MRLVIEDASGTRSEVPFDGDEITLGRAQEGNTFRLTERNVSRRHARFVRASGTVWIEDLGSLTGTRVNGEPIAGRRRLHPGDLVEIGGYDLALLPSHERPAWPPPVPAGARTPPPPSGEASSGAAPFAPAPPAPTAEPRAPTPAPRAPAPASGPAELAPRPPAASGPAVVESPRAPTPSPGAAHPAQQALAPAPTAAAPAAQATPAAASSAPSARSGERAGVLGRALLAGAIALLLGFGAGWLAGTLTAPAPPRAGETPASR